MYVLVLRRLSRPTLSDPMDCSPPGSSVHGILQARRLEWVAISSSRDLPNAGIEHMSLRSPALAGRFFTPEPPGKPTSALNPIASTLMRAREERQSRRRPCKNRGRDYCSVARSQGRPGATRSWKRQGGSPPKSLGEPGSVNTFFKKKLFNLKILFIFN